MFKFLVLCACFALALGMARREAPAGGAGGAAQNLLEDLQKNAQEFQKTFTEQLNALANSKNTQEVNKALKEGSDSVLQQLSTLSTSLQSVLVDANGKARKALEESHASLQKTAEQLRAAHPEVEQQATQLKEKLQAAIQQTAQEAQKLAKEVAANIETTNEKLAPKIKEAYETFVKGAENVQKQIHEAASKQQ